ncbi:hypothetical protein [Cognatiyoonia sp.]|uniref:hypothetical protein n=1 Tax=Cognatiyoonia sp. TaxID=2211652 RepID=UPI003F696CD3
MKCFACLPHAHDDHYPNYEVRVMGATQRSDLELLRTREALINREDDEDVYLVGAPFTVSWAGEGGGSGGHYCACGLHYRSDQRTADFLIVCQPCQSVVGGGGDT